MPLSALQIGAGALGVGSTIFSAIKGGQANQENEQLLAEQQEKNEAFYNNRQNFMETNMASSVLERARKDYENRSKISDSKAAVTGASAEQQVAEKTKMNEGYNDVVRNLAEVGTRYTQNNEWQYQNNLNRLLSTKMQLNQQKANNAANAASNAGNLFTSAAMLEGFGNNKPGAETGIQ